MTLRAALVLLALGCLITGCPSEGGPLQPRVDLTPPSDGGVLSPRVLVYQTVHTPAGWHADTVGVPAWLVGGCCAVTAHPVALITQPGRCPTTFQVGADDTTATRLQVCASDQERALAMIPRPPSPVPGSDLADELITPGTTVRLLFGTEDGVPAVVTASSGELFTLRLADTREGAAPSTPWAPMAVPVLGRSGAVVGFVTGGPDPRSHLARAVPTAVLARMMDDCQNVTIPPECRPALASEPPPSPAKVPQQVLVVVVVCGLGLLVAVFVLGFFLRLVAPADRLTTPEPATVRTERDGLSFRDVPACRHDGMDDTLHAPLGEAPAYVVSDLHVGEGLRHGAYTGTENFFADDAFGRWIETLIRDTPRGAGGSAPAPALVLNGDVFDFLRFCRMPAAGDLDGWLQLLTVLQCAPPGCTLDSLNRVVMDERGLGLHTDDYKSVWKLYAMRHGHPGFFLALASWLAQGHRLFVTKGNHDIEWHWAAVRRCFLWLLAEERTGLRGCALRADPEAHGTVLAELHAMAPQVAFSDRAVVFDHAVHIEHGHLYDTYARVEPPYVDAHNRLRVPVGSEFNRYLLNRIELAYPFLDNVRPSDNVFALLLRERLPLALHLIFLDVPRLGWRLLRHPRFMGLVLGLAIVLITPVAVGVVFLVTQAIPTFLTVAQGRGTQNAFGTLVSTVLQAVAMPLLAYGLARMLAAFTLRQPDALNRAARTQVRPGLDDTLQIVTFGHTHNPAVDETVTPRFYNTGTWIPIVEFDIATLRDDRSYTFLEITRATHHGHSRFVARLLRWNDDAGRVDPGAWINRR